MLNPCGLPEGKAVSHLSRGEDFTSGVRCMEQQSPTEAELKNLWQSQETSNTVPPVYQWVALTVGMIRVALSGCTVGCTHSCTSMHKIRLHSIPLWTTRRLEEGLSIFSCWVAGADSSNEAWWPDYHTAVWGSIKQLPSLPSWYPRKVLFPASLYCRGREARALITRWTTWSAL